MNRLLSFFVFAICMVLIISTTQAQLRTPAPSPSSTVMQAVGLGEITVEYSRPGVKGRTVMGDLVPFGKIWRTGANQSTKITFSEDVTFGGKEVKAGKYAIYSIPGKDKWSIMLTKQLNIGGAVNRYDESMEVARIEAESMQMTENMENFTIMFDNLTDHGAHMFLAWEKTVVPVEIKVNTDAQVVAQIEKLEKGLDANFYFSAATYYFNNDKDVNKAAEWITKASEMQPNAYWVHTWKARIYGKAGKKSEAIATSKKALNMAKEAGNQDYVKINTDLLTEWGAM